VSRAPSLTPESHLQLHCHNAISEEHSDNGDDSGSESETSANAAVSFNCLF
jgi:hypothetical protein